MLPNKPAPNGFCQQEATRKSKLSHSAKPRQKIGLATSTQPLKKSSFGLPKKASQTIFWSGLPSSRQPTRRMKTTLKRNSLSIFGKARQRDLERRGIQRSHRTQTEPTFGFLTGKHSFQGHRRNQTLEPGHQALRMRRAQTNFIPRSSQALVTLNKE